MECSQRAQIFRFLSLARIYYNFSSHTLLSGYASFYVRLFAWIARAARDEREIEDVHATICDWRRLRRKKIESNEECFFGIFFSTSHVVVDNNSEKDDELAIFHRSGGRAWLMCDAERLVSAHGSSRSVGPLSRVPSSHENVSLWSHLRRLRIFLFRKFTARWSRANVHVYKTLNIDSIIFYAFSWLYLMCNRFFDLWQIEIWRAFHLSCVALVFDTKQDCEMRSFMFFSTISQWRCRADRINKLKYFRAFYPFSQLKHATEVDIRQRTRLREFF